MHGNSIYKLADKPAEEALVRKALNDLAREQMKERILKDIKFDVAVCKLEGWDYKEYLNQIIKMVSEFL